MGRHNRRRGDEHAELRTPGGWLPSEVQELPDGDWVVRRVTGAATTKAYRCPGCDQEIRPATPHIVAWPDGGASASEDRRHWHSPCWEKRTHRRPKK